MPGEQGGREEYLPLYHWSDRDNTKTTNKDTFQGFFEIFQIAQVLEGLVWRWWCRLFLRIVLLSLCCCLKVLIDGLIIVQRRVRDSDGNRSGLRVLLYVAVIHSLSSDCAESPPLHLASQLNQVNRAVKRKGITCTILRALCHGGYPRPYHMNGQKSISY